MTPIADPTDDPTGAPDGPDNPGGHHTPARLAAAGGRDQPEGASGRGNTGGVDLAGALTWAEVAAQAVDDLRRSGHEGPDIDVRRIIEEVSGAEGAAYPRVLDEGVSVRRLARFDALVARRRAGEPLQYVLGRWAFRALDLLIDGRVLIPRPETEEVAGRALVEVRRQIEERGTTYANRLTVADLGTGSGAIGLALAQEEPLVNVWATDLSAEALAVARANTAGIGRAAARVRLAEGSWFEALPAELAGTLAVIVANPPYVAVADPLPPEVADWEPPGALLAGPTGREALEHLVDHAGRWLLPGGALVLELDPGQAGALAERAAGAGYPDVDVHDDLAGRPRVLVARSPGGRDRA